MKFLSALRFHNEWFLWLCPAFLVTRGFVRFSASVAWQDVLLLFFEYSVWDTVLTLFFSFFLSFRKAALFSASLVLFNAVYSTVYEFSEAEKSQLFFTRFGFIAVVALLLFVVLFLYLRRTKRKLTKATRFLNVVFSMLIITEVISFGIDLTNRNRAVIETNYCPQCPTPDVYLVVTDGYAGKKQLREQFGLDNTPFEDTLRSLGFHVIDSSFSNYTSTNVSMSSVLRMDYVAIEKDVDLHASFSPTGVTSFFKNQGYQLINNSIFTIDGQLPNQPTGYFKTGTVLLTQYSFIAHATYIVHNLLAASGYSVEKERVSRIQGFIRKIDLSRDSITLQNLLATAKQKGDKPKFVYTHFLMPHAPYLFNENGQVLKDTGSLSSQYRSYHLYTNKQLISAVRSILQSSERPPIILLLSDHGARTDDWQKFGRLHFSNLAAVYLPNKTYEGYYSGMSNVNQFRVLLNRQFNQQLPLLPDSTVY